MTNNTITGYYSIAEKIAHAFGGLATPLTQAIYPLLSEKYLKNKHLFFRYIDSLSVKYITFSIIMVIVLYAYSDLIISIISGEVNRSVVEIYYILILTVITIPLGPLFTQVLNITKFRTCLSKISKYTFVFSVILSPIGILFYSTVGLAVVAVSSQILIIALYINKIKNFRNNKSY